MKRFRPYSISQAQTNEKNRVINGGKRVRNVLVIPIEVITEMNTKVAHILH
jgi:hypothetical protein